MNIKNIPEKALRKIIANNYLGEHDKRGRQTDYSDYSEEINQHLWQLSDRRLMSKQNFEDVPDAELPSFIDDSSFCRGHFLKAFNRWGYIQESILTK